MGNSVWAKNGMISTAQSTATAAGLAVLQGGGNAVDATIAAALVLNVVMPMMCGLGGDVFALVHEAKTGRVHGVGGSGVSPRGATREWFLAHGYQSMPLAGMASCAVPGAVRACYDMLERWGTRAFAELAAPAVAYAERGFVVSPRQARQYAAAEAKLREFPTTAAVFLSQGRAPRPGEVLRQPDLAATLRLLAESGPDEMYSGRLAERILRYANDHGGLWDGQEWAAHCTEIYEPPLGVTYRGRDEVLQTRPPSQGFLVLEELNLVEGFELRRHGDGEQWPPQADAETVHLLVESKKLAFADRNRHAGDPKVVDFDVRRLLDKGFAAERRRAIDPRRAALEVPGADLQAGDTTSLVCVDGEGNAVSFIHSLSLAFGCAEVAGDTGVLLNNRAGRGFNLLEGHPNCVAPQKRTMHTLHTYLVRRGGRPHAVGNTPGGDGQPQWNLQVLTNLLDLGLSVEEAIAAPRWHGTPGTDPATLDEAVELLVESRMAADVRQDLLARGHRLRVLGPWAGGGDAQLIRIHASGVLEGASDPRGEGVTAGI